MSMKLCTQRPESNESGTDASGGRPPSRFITGACLLFAVAMCSSAGVVFDVLTSSLDVPPFLAAFWRLFIQNAVQLMPFLWSLNDQWKKDDDRRKVAMTYCDREPSPAARRRSGDEKMERDENVTEELFLPRYWKAIPLCILSGVFLGVHFSMWVFSLRFTSITHSLLWVSMGPIVLNGGAWFLHLLGQNRPLALTFAAASVTVAKFRRPSMMETMGVLFGIFGAIVMVVGVKQGGATFDANDENEVQDIQPSASYHPPTLYGDAAAFSGAVAVCGYLVIGQKLRAFLPVWLYVFPVVGSAALTCLVFSLLDPNDPCKIYGITRSSVFGFLSKEYFGYVLYLGVGPGICGHTLLNTLLKYISPLVVSTAMLMEPVIGSVIGYYCGLQPIPGMYTWVGGFVLIIGLIMIVNGENQQSAPIEDETNPSGWIEGNKDCNLKMRGNKMNSYGAI